MGGWAGIDLVSQGQPSGFRFWRENQPDTASSAELGAPAARPCPVQCAASPPGAPSPGRFCPVPRPPTRSPMRLLQRTTTLWILLLATLALPAPSLAQEGAVNPTADVADMDPDELLSGALEAALKQYGGDKADAWTVTVDKPKDPPKDLKGPKDPAQGPRGHAQGPQGPQGPPQ